MKTQSRGALKGAASQDEVDTITRGREKPRSCQKAHLNDGMMLAAGFV
jgi:hypothetical protein